MSTVAPSARDVVVIGAGIVGISTALFLQRDGCRVQLYDPQPPGTGASYGNAGLLSVDACVPIAAPGMLRKVPRWLSDPTGPLAINPRYFPTAAPWLMRWIRAGRLDRVEEASNALRLLHVPAIEHYRLLLGSELFSNLIRVDGQIHVFETDMPTRSDEHAQHLRDRFEIETRNLSLAELHDVAPGISPSIRRALLFPRHGHVVNPLRLVQTLVRLFLEAGGTLKQERVMKILPTGRSTFRLLTNVADTEVGQIVLTGGALSRRLLRPLGVDMPLETERGYHVELRSSSVDLKIPLLHKEKGFGATPMENGLRVAGTVEIAGLDLPPNEQRGEALLQHARRLFPKIEVEQRSMWMGFRPSMPDSVPVLGPATGHPGLFIACGHGHTGVTAGAISGRLISQLVMQKPPVIDPAPFRLSRF